MSYNPDNPNTSRMCIPPYDSSGYVYSNHQDIHFEPGLLDDKFQHLAINALSLKAPVPLLTARDIVLRRCNQVSPLSFKACYNFRTLKNCQKIGEGVYGEVFLFRDVNGGTTVMKIIPIEGDTIVNDERQKTFEEILSEIIVSQELSDLRNKKKNYTTAFSQVKKIRCVQGAYPSRLLELWDLYAENKKTLNDCPDIFHEDQLYVILELANGGTDMEAFVFEDSVQVFSLIKQVVCALAVAELELQFEHRDLHWGNILISKCQKDKKTTFVVDGKEITFATQGVEISIIDFTFSRLEIEGGVVIFNDLAHDNDIFNAKGDYQFDVYRLMQKKNRNNWHNFEPYTNILWLHYILDKAINSVHYQNISSNQHKEYLDKLVCFKNVVLNYNSCMEFIHVIV